MSSFIKIVALAMIILSANCSIVRAQRSDSQENNATRLSAESRSNPLIVMCCNEKTYEVWNSLSSGSSLDIFQDNPDLLRRDLIKSITMLRSRDETVHYGERGKNGVVIINFSKKHFKKLPDSVKKSFR